MKKIVITLVLLTSMAAPTFAQSFDISYVNVSAYSQQQTPVDSSSHHSEGGGA